MQSGPFTENVCIKNRQQRRQQFTGPEAPTGREYVSELTTLKWTYATVVSDFQPEDAAVRDQIATATQTAPDKCPAAMVILISVIQQIMTGQISKER
jgi:hypothetical protein